MKIVLLGAPGAGKGTQALSISNYYNIPHISTGDIFRKNISQGTPLGVTAKGYMDKGQLVPDQLTLDLIEDRLNEEDCNNGYLLDGYPRTVVQAEFLEKLLEKQGTGLDCVAWARQCEALGAGALLPTSMDGDGTLNGYDIEFTRAIADAVALPVIASGGAGALEHFSDVVEQAGVSAVLAASATLASNSSLE